MPFDPSQHARAGAGQAAGGQFVAGGAAAQPAGQAAAKPAGNKKQQLLSRAKVCEQRANVLEEHLKEIRALLKAHAGHHANLPKRSSPKLGGGKGTKSGHAPKNIKMSPGGPNHPKPGKPGKAGKGGGPKNIKMSPGGPHKPGKAAPPTNDPTKMSDSQLRDKAVILHTQIASLRSQARNLRQQAAQL